MLNSGAGFIARFGGVMLAGLSISMAAQAVALANTHDGCCRDGNRPHQQALNGPVQEAPVEILKAPVVGGKGGGVDPGNDYPDRWKHVPQDSVLDQWKEYNRECTSFVAWALHSRNGFEMPFYKNANRWGPAAVKRGFLVNSQPALGSIAWSNKGVWGHVAYVVAVHGGNVTVEEYNFLTRGGYDKRVTSASTFTGFIHFKDFPKSDDSPADSSPVSPLAPATGLPVSTTNLIETTGGIANTWTDYKTAEGVQGPSILSNFPVEVACRVSGFQVLDGNSWWYRIASSPWSGIYYASADAFYNNGQTSGSLIGTPFVDLAVPLC